MTRQTLLALLLLPGVAPAADKPPPATPAPPRERWVHVIRPGVPAALARAVEPHFAKEVTCTETPAGLLLSGPSSAVAEVVKLLDQFERPARTVVLDVTLVDISAKKDDAAEPDLAGPEAEVAAKLDGLVKGGQATVRHVRVMTTDGQEAKVTTGGQKPFSSSRTQGPGGGFQQRTVTYTSIGTTVKATARVASAVTVQLDLEDGRTRPAEPADEPPTIERLTVVSTLAVPPGRTVVAHSTRTDGKAGRSVSLVLVSARVVEPTGK